MRSAAPPPRHQRTDCETLHVVSVKATHLATARRVSSAQRGVMGSQRAVRVAGVSWISRGHGGTSYAAAYTSLGSCEASAGYDMIVVICLTCLLVPAADLILQIPAFMSETMPNNCVGVASG